MYLNLKKSDLNKYVYRTIPFDRLIELFRTKENTLVKPSLWEDKFENFILKAKLQTQAGEIIDYDVHERLYGQCWTLEKSSDAMWRIYSPDKKSIRIRTTIGDLFNSLNESSIDASKFMHSIGKVEYIREEDLSSRAKSSFEVDGNIRFSNLFNSLLIKRRAFKHENEVRLMCLDCEGTGFEKVYKYSIDPHKLISQMMIDPRIPFSEFKKIESNIRSETSFKGGIKRSLLYRLPEDLTFNVEIPKM